MDEIVVDYRLLLEIASSHECYLTIFLLMGTLRHKWSSFNQMVTNYLLLILLYVKEKCAIVSIIARSVEILGISIRHQTI